MKKKIRRILQKKNRNIKYRFKEFKRKNIRS